MGQSNVESTACEECPNLQTTRFAGATASDRCGCGVGSFFNNQSNKCASCVDVADKDGMTCDEFGKMPILQPGFMTLPAGTVVYSCDKREKPCPGLVYIATYTCPEGSSEVACSFCGKQNTWDAGNGLCSKCSTASKAVFIVFAIVVVGGLGV